MRPLRGQKLSELEPEVRHELLRGLGSQAIADWGSRRFQEMDDGRQERLAAYLGRRIMSHIERRVLLHTISRLWIGYLTDIEDLRQGIGLEAFGQRDPLVEYKRRAYEMFQDLTQEIRQGIVSRVFALEPFELSIGKDA